jgi:hypothetical protein
VILLAKKKGEAYKCDECGLVVVVENPCECDESCELVCCQEPMKPAKAATKNAAPKASAPKK